MALVPFVKKCRKRMRAEIPRFQVAQMAHVGRVERPQGSEKAEMEGSGISHIEKEGGGGSGGKKIELHDSKTGCVEMPG